MIAFYFCSGECEEYLLLPSCHFTRRALPHFIIVAANVVGRERQKEKKKQIQKKRDYWEGCTAKLMCCWNAWWNAVRVKGCIIHAVGISVLEPVTKILNIQLGGREKGYFRYRRWMRFLQAAVEITLAAAGEACRQRLRSKVLSVLTLDLLPCSVYTLTNCRIIV